MYQNIDRTKPQKLYHQLLEILKELIEGGQWKVGTQIPTEEQLCSQYNVSKATVRCAVTELVSLGYLKKFQGKGTFLRRRKRGGNIEMLASLDEGYSYHDPSHIVRVIENKTVLPEEDVRDCFNLGEGDFCFFLSRLIIADGAPLSLQRFHIPYGLMSGGPMGPDDMSDLAMYAVIEDRFGIKIQRVKEMIDLSEIGKNDAGLLETPPGTPLLRVRHICYGYGDRPVIFCESLRRTDKYKRALELQRMKI